MNFIQNDIPKSVWYDSGCHFCILMILQCTYVLVANTVSLSFLIQAKCNYILKFASYSTCAPIEKHKIPLLLVQLLFALARPVLLK